MKPTYAVILAAGEGKRLAAGMPKPLVVLHGKPLVQHVLDALTGITLAAAPIIVVGVGRDQMKNVLGSGYQYVIQEEQLGTGHSALMAEPLLSGKDCTVLVFYADQPYVTTESIQHLLSAHAQSGAPFTMATAKAPDFTDWRATLYSFGRFVRDEKGDVMRLTEMKDADPALREHGEVNPGIYAFDAAWLWSHAKKLSTHNVQGEYYLTDLVAMAYEEGTPIATVAIDPKEALGVNSREDLELLERTFGT